MIETSRERARRRLVLLVALARRPGTPEEGQAAHARIELLCRKYGFKVRPRTGEPSFVTPRRESRARRVWVVNGAGEAMLREDGVAHASDLTGEHFACASCGRVSRRRAEGRRARFCSPACRVRFHRLNGAL